MRSRKGMIGLGLLVLVVGTACGLSTTGGTPEAESGETAPTAAPAEESMLPVSINEGLASLNSYRMTVTSDSTDSETRQRTLTTFAVASDQEADATYNRTETRVTGEAGEVVSEQIQEQYVIGNQACSLVDGEAELSEMSDATRVMTDLMSRVVVFNPLIEHPVYVGDDVVNGVPVRRYTFEVRSLGSDTGVEPARADGSYAVAVDGEYLMYYRLDMELRTGVEGDPEAESAVFALELVMSDVNQPVGLVFPAGCQGGEIPEG